MLNDKRFNREYQQLKNEMSDLYQQMDRLEKHRHLIWAIQLIALVLILFWIFK